MALIIPQLSFGAISETPRLKIQITIIQSLSVPWDTQEELMDEMSGLGNALKTPFLDPCESVCHSSEASF